MQSWLVRWLAVTHSEYDCTGAVMESEMASCHEKVEPETADHNRTNKPLTTDRPTDRNRTAQPGLYCNIYFSKIINRVHTYSDSLEANEWRLVSVCSALC